MRRHSDELKLEDTSTSTGVMVDAKDPTTLFVKSRQVIAGPLNKLLISAWIMGRKWSGVLGGSLTPFFSSKSEHVELWVMQFLLPVHQS